MSRNIRNRTKNLGTVNVRDRKSKNTRSVSRSVRDAQKSRRVVESSTAVVRPPNKVGGRTTGKLNSTSDKPVILQKQAIAPARGEGLVVVSVPIYKARDTVRKAIQSVLNQTYQNLVVVAVSDADPDHSLRTLDDLNHPRLVKYRMPKNVGPYYIHDLVLRAGLKEGAEYLAIQDSDDHSPSDRISYLVKLCVQHRADAAFGGYIHVRTSGEKVAVGPQLQRWGTESLLTHLAHHGAGIYSARALEHIGGYYGGVRVGFDTAIQRAITELGRVVYVNKPLYRRVITADSLTTSPKTGHKSAYRERVKVQLRSMIKAMLDASGMDNRREVWKHQIQKHATRTAEDEQHVESVARLIGSAIG